VVAIQEERLLRSKRANLLPWKMSLALQYCFDTAGIAPEDLSAIAVCSTESTKGTPNRDVSLNSFLRPLENEIPIYKVGHHLGHAAGAFATSGFKESAVLIVDGSGSPLEDLEEADLGNLKHIRLDEAQIDSPHSISYEAISLYYIDETQIVPLEKHVSPKLTKKKDGMPYFWSFGSLYSAVGIHVFDSELDGAGKIMGLAPYGKPMIPVRDLFEIVNDGYYMKSDVPRRYNSTAYWPERAEEYKDLAASFQVALEEGVLSLVSRLRGLTSSNNLCYAGGVALNSVANERIIREGKFDNVFIMPAAEDSGSAIGAAYCALWRLKGRNVTRKLMRDSVGRRYSTDEISQAISTFPAIRVARPDDVFDATVDLLCQGKIIGWFQEGSELGPRALGQRSILCDPRGGDMKDRVNATVKFREGFRPFAPAILHEKLGEWFEVNKENDESPYMLRVMRFREECAKRVPAVAHVDGTGRVQTIRRESNERLYKLLQKFYERTGVPILLNTSFNIAGDPIVETPEDALCCLLFTGLDVCVLEDQLVEKQPGVSSPLDLYLSLAAERIILDQPAHAFTGATQWDDAPIAFLRSYHLDRASDVEHWILNYQKRMASEKKTGSILRIITKTRFGRVMYITTASTIEILKLCNGKRTGWEILDTLSASGGFEHDVAFARHVLAILKSRSIVNLHSSPI
jgi:carbamoyltransferase